MKINLPFYSNSILKVITSICLLITIISSTHIISVTMTFNSQLESRQVLNKLMTLKMASKELIQSIHYYPELSVTIAKDIDKLITSDAELEEILIKKQQMSPKEQALFAQWKSISDNINASNFTNNRKLDDFISSLENITAEYQQDATDKVQLIFIIEIMSFILILLMCCLLYFYSKTQINVPIYQLLNNAKCLKAHQFNVDFPSTKNEIGLLSKCLQETSNELRQLLENMQSKVSSQTIELEKAHQTIEFLYSISQQLNTVKLTSPLIRDALESLVKQVDLEKLCIELNNGTFIQTQKGCASIDKKTKRIAIVINEKPYGFLNYVSKHDTPEQHALIESFTGLIARALYQEELSVQDKKLLLMDERNIIARELHDSIAQSLSFLKIQCTLLHRQLDNESLQQAQLTTSNIQEVISDTYIQLRSLLTTFRISNTESNFKDAMLTMIEALQKQTSAIISLNKYEKNFYVDASDHIHLLQIVRESIINAIKHAQCQHIEISYLITDQHNVWFNIIDDGRGIIDNGQQYNHYGLSIMKQRADKLGATLTINRLNQGTEVKLIFPYKGTILNQGTENE